MKLIDRALSAVGLERRSTNPNDPWAAWHALRQGQAAGAEGVSAAYACISANAAAVSTMPLVIYKRQGAERVATEDHALHYVWNVQANPEMTAQTAREYLSASTLTHGNGYARLEFGSDGQLKHFWPLDPNRVQVLRLPNRALVYEYTDESGTKYRLLDSEVLHLRHRLGSDLVMGVSPIQAARGVFDLAVREQAHGVDTFSNGAKLLGVLKVQGKLKPEQKADIKDGWRANSSGQTPILEHGADYQPLSMSLVDSQWLESRRFSVEEICRVFSTPPSVVGHLTDSNYSTSEQLAKQWITMGLRRPLVAIEQAILTKCLTPDARKTYTVEHDYEGLLRGNSLERAQFYAAAIKSGWMLPAEVRQREYLPKLEVSHV